MGNFLQDWPTQAQLTLSDVQLPYIHKLGSKGTAATSATPQFEVDIMADSSNISGRSSISILKSEYHEVIAQALFNNLSTGMRRTPSHRL